MHQSKNTGYLHDLLPIIAVILILLPVLACAVHRAREASEQQTCTENLKRLGVACDMYQADWDDVLVPYGAPFQWAGTGGAFWPQLLDVYIRKIPGGRISTTGIIPPEYRCPSQPDQAGFAYERTYGINTHCGGWMPGGTPIVVPLKKVKYPHATIRIAEVSYMATGGSWFAARPTSYVPGDPACWMFPERHSGKGNVLWIDGHVSAMTVQQYNIRDDGPYYGQIWLRLEGPKPAVPQ